MYDADLGPVGQRRTDLGVTGLFTLEQETEVVAVKN